MIKLSEILFEDSKYEKETGEKLPNWQDKLKTYEASKDYFVHFSNVPRVALYIVNKFDTPIGFYAYPLDFNKMENFAVSRPYAIVFKTKPDAKILDLKNYSASQYASDLAKLKDKYIINDTQVNNWEAKARVQSPAGFLWNITRILSIEGIPNTVTEAYNIPDPNAEPRARKQLSTAEQEKRDKYISKLFKSYIPTDPDAKGGGSTGKWTMILNKVLGYDGVIDDCLKIIHYSEPCQTVFFNTNIIDIKDIVQITKKISKKEELFNTKINYSNRNFSGKDLSGKDLSDAILIDINLSNANLKSATLKKAILTQANLTGANLQDANLTGANFTGANLEGADLRNANLYAADLSFVNLKGANLYGANLQSAELESAILPNADLQATVLKGASLYFTDLEGANLMGVNLTGVSLANANLADADLADAVLEGANLRGANLAGANLIRANFTGTDFRNADLRGANLQGANLNDAIFVNALYDKDTKFPNIFSPKNKKMRLDSDSK